MEQKGREQRFFEKIGGENLPRRTLWSLLYSDTTSKSFLSTVSQVSTSCNVNSNEKSYSSSYSKVFSKPIATDFKYSSFKTEDPLFLLEDGVLSDGDGPVDSSCIYKSKYDVAT